MHCGIAPGGELSGCDLVPSGVTTPAGANENVVDASAPARYIHSDTKTFTRDVAELVPGHRITNGPAVCWLGYQGGIHGEIDDHSFTMNGGGATLK